MHSKNLKNYLYVLIFISAIAWVIFTYCIGVKLSNIKYFFELIPKVVTVDVIIVGLFVKYGWKWRVFRGWLVVFPNLNGTWVGFIYSNWQNPETGQKPAPIPVMLTIKQSFCYINFMMRTSEMESFSYSEGFIIDPEKQIKKITYSYTSKPKISLNERSNSHDGTAVFQIIENSQKKLKGRYWTERKTTGEISFDYHSKKILDELPENFGKHPVTEIENSIRF
ncbi:hypothetical protein H3T52_03550 [Commensalibacter sp. M0402]|uniref:Cap15 family cyclic dinucleotide receptor domain-containing protein n=1 Tax=Commensalibacter TaxID=1079922 RepID=UPI0018DC938E|nr:MULTISPECIES: hypothetical protein [Commensalibacter]MBI0083157.1 hypothetical protein [Commensalibacter sp. W6292M3]MBI0088025.1 hypothetical protein [Commensalibacter melissae]